MNILFVALAMMQGLPGAPSPIPVSACAVVPPSSTDPNGSETDVYVACGEHDIWLGKAASYRSAYNAGSRSLLVETTGLPGKRVQLVSLDAGGVPHIDDVTRELTRLSGHYVEAGLSNIAVDLTAFAGSGAVSVPVTVMPTASVLPTMPAAGAVAGATAGMAVPRPVAAMASSSVTTAGTASLDLLPYAAGVAAITPPQATAVQQGSTVNDGEGPAAGR